MRLKLAALILLIGAPSLAQPGPLPSMGQPAAPMDQAQWGMLTELVGRDFVRTDDALVTFRWIEGAGSAQAVKLERLIAEGKLTRGAPLTQWAVGSGNSVAASLNGAMEPAELAEFAEEPEPAIEIDPETGAVKQTPGGAMRFLDTLAQQGSLTIVHHYQLWPSFTFTSKLDRVRRGSDCQAQFLGRPEFIGLPNSGSYPAGTPQFEAALRQIAGMHQHQPFPWIVDWSKVSDVSFGGLNAKSANDQKTVILSGARLIALRLPSEALARRVHYAMQFLKEACDPTADTGF